MLEREQIRALKGSSCIFLFRRLRIFSKLVNLYLILACQILIDQQMIVKSSCFVYSIIFLSFLIL